MKLCNVIPVNQLTSQHNMYFKNKIDWKIRTRSSKRKDIAESNKIKFDGHGLASHSIVHALAA